MSSPDCQIRRLPLLGVFACVALLGALPAVAQVTRAQETEFHRAVTRALAHGDHDEARRLAEERDAADPSAVAVLARLDIVRGEYAAAEERLTPVAAANPVSGAGLLPSRSSTTASGETPSVMAIGAWANHS